MKQPCEFRHCISVVEPGRRFCPVHDPRAVLERVREIIDQHLSKHPTLHDAVVRDLEQTV